MFASGEFQTPRVRELAWAARDRVARRTDRLFVRLLFAEWLTGSALPDLD